MTLGSGIGDFEIGRKRKRTSHRGGRERAKTSGGEGGGKRERTRKGHGVPYTLVSAEEDEEKRVGGYWYGNSAGSARAAAGTRASRVHSRSSNIAGGAREISINSALCNVPRDRGDHRTIYHYRELYFSSSIAYNS